MRRKKQIFLVFGILWVILYFYAFSFAVVDDEFEGYLSDGKTYLVRNQPDKAIAAFNQAIRFTTVGKTKPKYAEVYYYRAKAYEQKGNLQQALSDYTEAIEINPHYLLAYYGRAIIYQKIDLLDLAILDYNEILRQDKNQAHAYNNRGLVYYLKNNLEEAIADLNKAIELDPKLINAHFNRGLVYLSKKQYPEAIYEFEKELENYSHSFAAQHYKKAVLHFYNQQYNESWKEVKILEAAKHKVNPIFIEELKKASGREK